MRRYLFWLLGCVTLVLLLSFAGALRVEAAITSPGTDFSGQVSDRQTNRPPEQAAPQRSQMPPDIQRVLKRGRLIVAVLNQDNPPFFMTREGKLEGSDIQVTQSIAEQLGVPVEFNRSVDTFDQVVQLVYRLDADLAVSKLSRTMKRARSVRFSQPYVTMRQGLLVNRLQLAQQANGRSVTEVIRDLEGRVGVIQGSSYVGFTQKQFPKAQVVQFPSWPDAVGAVIRGEVLAAYRDELEVKKVVLTKPDVALQLQTIALSDTEDAIAIALPWDSQQLLAFVNQALDTFHIKYTADSLLERQRGRTSEDSSTRL